jgi:hypothetical protein
LIIIKEFGPTQSISDDWIDPLRMDEAYLNISNKNYPQTITVKHNLVVCEECDFEILLENITEKSNEIVIINTKYSHEFQIVIESLNKPFPCEKKSYHFSEGGSYLLEVIQTATNQSSCSIKPIDVSKSFRYWLPVIIGFVILFLFIISTQIWHRISQNQRFVRLLPNNIQQGLITQDFTISLPRNVNMIANDPDNDIINTLGTGNDLTLSGQSSRLPPNPIQMPKARPKRLRSLDTFRGFSLMIMIFVNYGGEIFFLFSDLLRLVVC